MDRRIRSLRYGLFAVIAACGAGCGDMQGREEGHEVKQQSCPSEVTRLPAVAGAFYPDSPAALRKQIQQFLDQVPAHDPGGEVLAAVAPHAGYTYSGLAAAYTHKQLAALDFDTIVIIGHDSYAPDTIAFVAAADAFETPLGRVPVARDMVEELLRTPGVRADSRMHAQEHTVEVHLPFLQVLNKSCSIVPVLFGDPTVENCRLFANALSRAAGNRKLFVLSSTDMSHYPPYDDANRLDGETLEVLKGFDVARLFSHLVKTMSVASVPNLQTALCSRGGVGTAMFFAQSRGADKVDVLKYANSGDTSGGDRRGVVGYGSALFVKSSGNAAAPKRRGDQPATNPPDRETFSLDPEAQKELLTLARRRLASELAGERHAYAPPAERKDLQEPLAVFVTLTTHGRLRGCIGMTEPHGPLWKAVYEMAHSAAFSDPRFPPVRQDELDELRIEISVLSPLRPVASADDIVPGRHGVVVRKGHRGGLFLPQVWEQLPDKEEFLNVLCSQKAGLPPGAWKDKGTQLLIFTVFAFEEEEP